MAGIGGIGQYPIGYGSTSGLVDTLTLSPVVEIITVTPADAQLQEGTVMTTLSSSFSVVGKSVRLNLLQYWQLGTGVIRAVGKEIILKILTRFYHDEDVIKSFTYSDVAPVKSNFYTDVTSVNATTFKDEDAP